MAGVEKVVRVVIADAGPLVALSRVGQLSLLRGLFGAVEVTEQIRAEVLDGGVFPGQGDIAAALDAGWLRCHSVDLSEWQPRYPGVDEGEASALLLAASHSVALVIMDDRAGRAEARARGFPVMGVAAIVGLAKMEGLILQASSVLAGMRENGYFIGNEVVAAILARVGEAST